MAFFFLFISALSLNAANKARDISAGLSYLTANNDNYAVGEFSYIWVHSLGIAPAALNTWISAGAGRGFSNSNSQYFYAEAGFLFFGLGFNHTKTIGLSSQNNLHLFFGIPIPFYSWYSDKEKERLHIFFIEPYYRPAWQLTNASFHPQYGIALKYLTRISAF